MFAVTIVTRAVVEGIKGVIIKCADIKTKNLKMKRVNSDTRICEWPDDSELGQKPAQNTKIIKINDGPSFPQLYGWTVCLPCVGSEIQENLKFFLSN